MLEGGGDEGEAEEGDEEPGAVGLRRQLLPEPLGVPLAILRDHLLVCFLGGWLTCGYVIV